MSGDEVRMASRAGCCGALALGLLLTGGCTAPAIRVGDRAPDFQLTALDGKTVKLSDFRGQPVLLSFWAYG
ncbi:MAG: redoxin domain-containing protein [Phycisphaerales bacterium]|nr:redoxin domain-containing protein [Phycisphaerales bacterium]